MRVCTVHVSTICVIQLGLDNYLFSLFRMPESSNDRWRFLCVCVSARVGEA
jgi:hypothetical protein